MKKLKGGKDMGLVQAQMAFYHDSVGTKAQNEIFEVQNENLCAELESAGYVKKLEATKPFQWQVILITNKQINKRNKRNKFVNSCNNKLINNRRATNRRKQPLKK